MHDHLFYQMGSNDGRPGAASFAMLYLASGVTTIRTAGALDLAGDLRIKRLIDAGRQPGPTIHVSSPYLYAIAETPDPERSARNRSRTGPTREPHRSRPTNPCVATSSTPRSAPRTSAASR